MQLQAAGLWPVAPPDPSLFIENLFSTYLYTGNNSTQTITNGIDLSTKGGLVWVKNRTGAYHHTLWDTVRGVQKYLYTSATNAESTDAGSLTAFNSNGFSLGNSDQNWNNSASSYVSWTFREQPKFFDVVTYTGTGVARTVAHNLGSVPGCIIVKRTNAVGEWPVYHRSLGNTNRVFLDLTNATGAASQFWNDTTPTATEFTVGTGDLVNQVGDTYVAYIFAHDAGGFGLTGTDNVISCGSYTGNGSADGPTVSLGYEPQWLLIKNASAAESGGLVCNWRMYDNMRGWATGGDEARLFPNLTNAENFANDVDLTSTGFKLTTTAGNVNGNGETFIYIAIRRGPMKVPTVGTSVFSPVAYTGDGTTRLYSAGFPTDLSINMARSLSLRSPWWADRLRGGTVQVFSDGAGAEGGGGDFAFDNQTSIYVSTVRIASGQTYIDWCFRRAPGFFDEVCYTGTGANRTVTHNLTVTPELMIIKGRSDATAWEVYCSALANTEYLVLNTTAAKATGATRWNSTTPTSSVFSVGTSTTTNNSAATYVAWLFATCPGVSKVGSYTGTATTLQIDCGFTAGSRFVLIKRTDSTGDWYMWDSARGIVAGNDPYLLLNTSGAEVTGTDYVDTYNAGFEISSTAPAAINASGGTYIFLAIA
jgi:hypothetical protein